MNSLPEQIAAALLTPYGGPEGTRLQIMLKRPDGTESDLGGNNKQSVIDAVSRVLNGRTDELTDCLKLILGNVKRGVLIADPARLTEARNTIAHAAAVLERHTAPSQPVQTAIHHIDGNPWNNSPENLASVDVGENRRPKQSRRCLEDKSKLRD